MITDQTFQMNNNINEIKYKIASKDFKLTKSRNLDKFLTKEFISHLNTSLGSSNNTKDFTQGLTLPVISRETIRNIKLSELIRFDAKSIYSKDILPANVKTVDRIVSKIYIKPKVITTTHLNTNFELNFNKNLSFMSRKYEKLINDYKYSFWLKSFITSRNKSQIKDFFNLRYNFKV